MQQIFDLSLNQLMFISQVQILYNIGTCEYYIDDNSVNQEDYKDMFKLLDETLTNMGNNFIDIDDTISLVLNHFDICSITERDDVTIDLVKSVVYEISQENFENSMDFVIDNCLLNEQETEFKKKVTFRINYKI